MAIQRKASGSLYCTAAPTRNSNAINALKVRIISGANWREAAPGALAQLNASTRLANPYRGSGARRFSLHRISRLFVRTRSIVNQAFFSLGLLASVAAQDANLPATEPVIVRGSEITAAEFTSASAAVGA